MQLRAEGGLALELYDGASGFGASRRPNEHVDDIRATLQQLDRMEQQVGGACGGVGKHGGRPF